MFLTCSAGAQRRTTCDSRGDAWHYLLQEAKLAFFEIVIPIILCFAGSVTYHTFMANNQNYHRWLFIDVSSLPTLCLAMVEGSGGLHD